MAPTNLVQSANIARPRERRFTLLTESVQSRTKDHAFGADNSTTNGHHGDFSGFSGEQIAGLDGTSFRSSSHTSGSNSAGAGQILRAGPIASTSAPRQANTGNNQWSLQEHPWDLLGIPRSAMAEPVSSQSTSAAGRSAQATSDSASGRSTWPQAANNPSNAQGWIPGSHNLPRSE